MGRRFRFFFAQRFCYFLNCAIHLPHGVGAFFPAGGTGLPGMLTLPDSGFIIYLVLHSI